MHIECLLDAKCTGSEWFNFKAKKLKRLFKEAVVVIFVDDSDRLLCRRSDDERDRLPTNDVSDENPVVVEVGCGFVQPLFECNDSQCDVSHDDCCPALKHLMKSKCSIDMFFDGWPIQLFEDKDVDQTHDIVEKGEQHFSSGLA